MLKTVYDPTNKNLDAFSMGSMVETVTAKVFTGTERTELAGIETGANKYVHPATHSPSIIAQDAENRFVTDAERTEWNSKLSTESDPTVPPWAKQPSKPTYTTAEVGAAASSHTHTQGDVTGLTAALAEKVALIHAAQHKIGGSDPVAASLTVTLPTTGWSGSGPYSIERPAVGVTPTGLVLISPAPASYTPRRVRGSCTARGTDTLTFAVESVPSVVITPGCWGRTRSAAWRGLW